MLPPLPERKPFLEAKLRIDTVAATDRADRKLVSLIASPELSLNQLGKREGRCRTHRGKLFRLSWLSPRISAAIIDGRQPARIGRRVLLEADLPTFCRGSSQNLAELRHFRAASYPKGKSFFQGILFGAVEKTRTSTGFRPQRPQRCASTSSATTALGYLGSAQMASPR